MNTLTFNRRGFFRTSAAAAGGLLVGFYLPERSKLAAETPTDQKLNAFVRVGTDDSVTLTIHRAELGQGSMTSLSMLLAEELECDFGARFAPKSRKWIRRTMACSARRSFARAYSEALSIRSSWDPLRQAGAAAREMLVGAAAQKCGASISRNAVLEKNTVINTTTDAATELWQPGGSGG